MTMVSVGGEGLWLPALAGGVSGNNSVTAIDTVVLDATEEEGQWIGYLHIDGGGTHTFGGGSSALGWLPGTPITFAANATLRLGAKRATSIQTTTAVPARATLGAAAFDVYTDLVGGTDTITATTWREDAMGAGTPFAVTSGDLIALCFHLTTTAGTPAVRVRGSAISTTGLPVCTLVTSGPTYTYQAVMPNLMLTLADGTLAWIEPTYACLGAGSVASTTIGVTNIKANLFRLPFPAIMDAVSGPILATTIAANFAVDLYTTPLGTPALLTSLTHDASIYSQSAARAGFFVLPTPLPLAAQTDYALGVRQLTATAVGLLQVDVNAAAHFATQGLGAVGCYAVDSTAGGTFAVQNTGKRRYMLSMRLSHIDNGRRYRARAFTGF
jgi:hypothetical protein